MDAFGREKPPPPAVPTDQISLFGCSFHLTLWIPLKKTS